MPSSMRCFKSFFKHTWHPQQMDTSSRFEPRKSESHQSAGETELGEVKLSMGTSSVGTATPGSPMTPSHQQPGSIPCKNGGCSTWRARPEPRAESPWHILKTVFLVSVIVALVIWVLVYTLLAQYQIL